MAMPRSWTRLDDVVFSMNKLKRFIKSKELDILLGALGFVSLITSMYLLLLFGTRVQTF